MMSTLFAWLNVAVYAVSSLWCTIATDKVMNFLGQSVAKPQGKIEFLSVYGGLEAGLGMYFLACAINPLMTTSGVRLGLCLYGALVAWRSIALLVYGIPPELGILCVFAAEILLLLLAVAAWLESRLRNP